MCCARVPYDSCDPFGHSLYFRECSGCGLFRHSEIFSVDSTSFRSLCADVFCIFRDESFCSNHDSSQFLRQSSASFQISANIFCIQDVFDIAVQAVCYHPSQLQLVDSSRLWNLDFSRLGWLEISGKSLQP